MQYGEYPGPVKATFDDIVEATIANGANTPVDINTGIVTEPRAGATYIALVITTTGNITVNLGDVATATSFALAAADTLICTLANDRPLGLWGVTGTPTVTIKRFIV